MKKLLLSCLFFTLTACSSLMDKANSAYRAYDSAGTEEKLQKALDALAKAAADPKTSSSYEFWRFKGDLYNKVLEHHILKIKLDPNVIKPIPGAAIQAHSAYIKALGLTREQQKRNGVLKGLTSLQGFLVGEGARAYEQKEYATAYTAFQAALEEHDLLKESERYTSVFQKVSDYNDQLYYTGLAALNAENLEAAKPLFRKLKDARYDKPAVFEALYKLELEKDDAAALAILEEGRARFPDDVSLLFNEINHYLKNGKLEELTKKLEEAIAIEPNNPTLYSTLGNAYDNLYRKAAAENNKKKTEEYFDLALQNYNKSLLVKPVFFDAIYGIGALYYSRAATTTTAMNALADDFSKDGLQKYDVLKEKSLKQFSEALPFFKQAESLNPNDRNTLIALKEIFARQDNLALTVEFRSRLELIESGGNIKSAYFK